MFHVVFVFYCYYLYVSCSGSITSVGEGRAYVCYRLLEMWFLFGEVSPSSWCLGWTALFYCGTPWAFNIIILNECQMGCHTLLLNSTNKLFKIKERIHKKKVNNTPQFRLT